MLKASVHRSSLLEKACSKTNFYYMACRLHSGSHPGSRRRKTFHSRFHFSNQLEKFLLARKDSFVSICTARCYNQNEDKRLCVKCVSLCLALSLCPLVHWCSVCFSVLRGSQTLARYTIHWSRFSIKFSYFPTLFEQAFSSKLDLWTEALKQSGRDG